MILIFFKKKCLTYMVYKTINWFIGIEKYISISLNFKNILIRLFISFNYIIL